MKRADPSILLTHRLAALSEPLRLRLARILESSDLSVGEVSRVVQLPQSTVSRNLKVLAEAGWIDKRAEGTAAYYRLTLDDLPPEARALWLTIREQLARAGDPHFDEDARRLQGVLAERRTDSVSFFGRVSGEWDAVRAELFGGSVTLRAMMGLLPRHWVVADIGCGTGNGAELIAPFVRQVIAVDQSEPMLQAARKRLSGVGIRNVTFVDGPIEALPLGDASVDAAMCLLVMHHVRELGEALGELRRIIKPGGRLLVMDMFEHDRAAYRHTMGHVHLGFNETTIRSLLDESGFTDTRITPIPPEAEAKGPGLFVATAERP